MTHAAENDAREVWGIQEPPSVWVGREYPVREWAERQLRYNPRGVLVSRFVTEWERVIPPGTLAESAGFDSQINK